MNNSRTETVLDSVLGAIGNTPLMELSRITRGLDGHILAKLEYLNPGYSKKDRIAKGSTSRQNHHCITPRFRVEISQHRFVVVIFHGSNGLGPVSMRLCPRNCLVSVIYV